MTGNFSTTEFWNRTNVNNSAYHHIFTSITLFVSAFGAAGNCLVIWFLSFKIKRSPSTIYIFNLALADAVFLLFVMFLFIITIILTERHPFEIISENVHVINVLYTVSLTCLFGFNTSMCLLTAISVERCISVIFPLWYHCKRPHHLSTIACSSIWILSSLFSAIEFNFCYKQKYIVHDLGNNSTNECTVVSVIICCVSFMIFTPLMILSSLTLLVKIWTSSQQQQPPKLYLVITVTVLLFLVFAMPMRIILLVWYKYHMAPPFPILDLFSLFCSVNSSINPFIYFLIGRQGGKGKFSLLRTLQGIFYDDGFQNKREKNVRTILETKI
ncbi:proto-oncogene Mas-like [Bombina bombina]|uniref:proto-oncogene Mas-like n=1 Tax=Bombina bombina TaxID=8345 RepID=UPI00235B2282|nr:proto-oncogene Mas-like [Bombina bombina]